MKLGLDCKRSLTVSAALCATACVAYPDSSERFDDDIVYTAHALEANFPSFSTFAINPTVLLATVKQDETVDKGTVDPSVADPVVASIASNMQQRGFRQVDPKDNPDLGLTVTAIDGLVEGSVTGGYWWGYYGTYWGYPGWGYYYPYDVDYSYRPGTLIVDMADLTGARSSYVGKSDEQPSSSGDSLMQAGGLPVVWTMVGYRAYVDASSTVRVAQATSAVEQGFAQSTYIRSE